MSDNPASGPEDKELEAFISHARWLVELHNKRSEQFGARAVALLGFTGVIVALLASGVDLGQKLQPTFGLWAALLVALVALALSALFALLTITTRKVVAPSAQQAHRDWTSYVSGDRRGHALSDIAESMLNSQQSEQTNPVLSAKAEADSRATMFRRSLWSQFVALVAVVLLIVQTYLQLERG